MDRRKDPAKEKMMLAVARHRKHRTRRIRAFRNPVPHDTNVSLVNPSDASSISAPQPILSDRDDAELSDMEEDEQDKLTRMHVQKALVSTLEWFQTFHKRLEEMTHNLELCEWTRVGSQKVVPEGEPIGEERRPN